jgi:hypothetical protein
MTQGPGLASPLQLFAKRPPRVDLTTVRRAPPWTAAARRIDSESSEQRCQRTAFGWGELGDIAMAQHLGGTGAGADRLFLTFSAA